MKQRNFKGQFIQTLIKKKCLKCNQDFIPRTIKQIFCSHKCYSEWRFDKSFPERHPHWKNGIYIGKDGYAYLRKSEHPFTNRDKYVLRSHLVAEKYLNRYLTSKEIIHHINEIKDDDKIENLYLFATKNEHTTYHLLLKKNKTILITKSNLI